MASTFKSGSPQKFSLAKLLEEARKRQTCGTKLSSPILARCSRSQVKTNPIESAPPLIPLTSMLQVQSVSINTVLIYSPKVNLYLAMDSNGKLYSRDCPNDEAMFHHVHELNDFHTFASNKYYKETLHDMFVALKNDGNTRKATKTIRLHKASQFLMISMNNCK
ncbi:fibroblast growth factor 1-like isoform X2 [Actinia tenebrosa]|uniref:Fibroblast growth factor n=1 Tax=Actinia tenebrosa TaxID=6105 RepID=A0A6P8H8B8_ACTTE|nr:fibroblast growth factor 1-like isoform X2 [Actinia tenebrosa]